uniref:Ribosomal RNA-processing protein 14/surfeit locus protein 6 C-terminal domain-containing protein n=1 Tax=Araucaria cunninghamii TaxID=56994 RepID=A0A0D6R023_ARACU
MAETEEEEYESSHSDEPKSTSFSSLKDLKNLIHENSLFFDRLVDLVPARFYIYPEDPPHPGYYGMSKSAKAAAKKATKENLKKAHRARLDPENYASTLELVKRKAEKEEQEKLKEGEAEQLEIREDNKAATYEELRKRLHQRIEKLQASRKEKKDSQKGKRKRAEVAGTQSTRDSVPQEAPSAKRGKEDVEKVKKDPEEDQSSNLEFGRVKISVGNEISKDRNKKIKESKAHLLEKAQKLQSTMQDPEKGQVVATEHSWSAATSRAAGIKVLDNPKLLKQSLKKDNKQHQKSVQKWKERTNLKEKALEERQQVRKEHITQRSQQKKDRLIAKREKKLLRPGFEGRKDGFINI